MPQKWSGDTHAHLSADNMASFPAAFPEAQGNFPTLARRVRDLGSATETAPQRCVRKGKHHSPLAGLTTDTLAAGREEAAAVSTANICFLALGRRNPGLHFLIS